MRGAFLFLFAICMLEASASMSTYSKDTLLMGVSFNITAVHEDPIQAAQAVDAGFKEIIRIEQLISSWNPSSQTSEINRQAGIAPVRVDAELYGLIERAKKISELSNGYFDISFASIHTIWDMEEFSQDEIPSKEEIAASVALIDYHKIILNPQETTVFLKEKGMRIGFGAIGKGYAANRVKELLFAKGIRSGVINAGGDLLSWGRRPDGESWKVGITDPRNDEKIIAWVESKDMAVVTSGNYKKFLIIDGQRYCHIINPKSGWPVTGLSSVTIVSRDAEIADALATTVFVLGKEEGLKLINHLADVECMIVTEEGERLFSKKMNAVYAESSE